MLGKEEKKVQKCSEILLLKIYNNRPNYKLICLQMELH